MNDYLGFQEVKPPLCFCLLFTNTLVPASFGTLLFCFGMRGLRRRYCTVGENSAQCFSTSQKNRCWLQFQPGETSCQWEITYGISLEKHGPSYFAYKSEIIFVLGFF